MEKYQSQLPYFIDENWEPIAFIQFRLVFKISHVPLGADFSYHLFSCCFIDHNSNNELLTMPCVCLWSFLRVSLKRTVVLAGNFPLWYQNPGVFFRSTLSCNISGSERKNAMVCILQIFSFWMIFFFKEKDFVTISDIHIVN